MRVQAIEPGEVQIHLLDWGQLPPNQAAGFSWFLLPEEQEIFQKHDWEIQGGEYLWSRLLVRALTAGYLGSELGAAGLSRDIHGKPFLKDSRLRFNLAHTERWVALSWSLRPVGIDIERIPSGENAKLRREWLVPRIFSRAEREYYDAQPEESKAGVFTRIFTLKEAYVKVLGKGLRIPLNGFSVPLPLQEQSQKEGWEFYSRIIHPAGLSLSHAAEQPEEGFLQYMINHWSEDDLADYLTALQARRPGSSRESYPAMKKGCHVHLSR